MAGRKAPDTGAFHVRGKVLPEPATRDPYVVEGRISSEPVKGGKTLATDGWILPDLFDAPSARRRLESDEGPT